MNDDWEILESVEMVYYDGPLAVVDIGKYPNEEQPRCGLKYAIYKEMIDDDYIEFRWQEKDLLEMLELLRKHKK